MTAAYTTLIDLVVDRATSLPEQEVLVFLHADTEAESVCYRRLHEDACRIGQHLRRAGIRPGDLVLLAFNHGYPLVATFLGSIYAGAIPSIFPYIVSEKISLAYEVRIQRQVQQLQMAAVLTLPHVAQKLRQVLPEEACQLFTIELEIIEPGRNFVPHVAHPHDIAYIQFSSGTTALPKGVMISHAATLNQIKGMNLSGLAKLKEVVVGWLPLYHDMGLLSQFLAPIWLNGKGILIAPSHWMRRPEVLLWAVHDYRGTATWMPNFAFRHCVQHTNHAHLTHLDLSSWELVGCGGEPIQYDGLLHFADCFAPYGLRPEALMAGYGMAENVLTIATSARHQAPNVERIALDRLQEDAYALPVPHDYTPSKEIVSCGPVLQGTEVMIVNDFGKAVAERMIGEVLIRGNSLFSGYYRQPDLETQAMHNGWFRTGDLGYLAENELYICDRKTDLIIAGGVNLYPDHIEGIVRSVLAPNEGKAVAFGLFDPELGTEQPVVVVEQRRLSDDEQRRLRQWISDQVRAELNVTLGDIRLVVRGWIEITTSGKIARSANRQKYVDSGFANDLASRTALAMPSNEQEWQQLVQGKFEEQLGVSHVELDDNYFERGGTSLSFVRLLLTLGKHTTHPLPAEQLVQQPTVREIASQLHRLATSPALGHEVAGVTGAENESSRLSFLYHKNLPNDWYRWRPYRTGTRLLACFSRQRWFLKVAWRQVSNELKQVMAEIASPVHPLSAIPLSMQTNVLMGWRWHAISRAKSLDGIVIVEGEEWLEQARHPHHPAILLVSHFGLASLHGILIPKVVEHDDMGAVGRFAKHIDRMKRQARQQNQPFDRTRLAWQLRTYQYFAALQSLQQGSLVVIAGDTHVAANLLDVAFHGRRRQFPTGFAQLAWETKADVIPFFVFLREDGKIVCRFHAPLAASRKAQVAFVGEMVHQYVDLLAEQWATNPGNIDWELLPKYLALPHVIPVN